MLSWFHLSVSLPASSWYFIHIQFRILQWVFFLILLLFSWLDYISVRPVSYTHLVCVQLTSILFFVTVVYVKLCRLRPVRAIGFLCLRVWVYKPTWQRTGMSFVLKFQLWTIKATRCMQNFVLFKYGPRKHLTPTNWRVQSDVCSNPVRKGIFFFWILSLVSYTPVVSFSILPLLITLRMTTQMLSQPTNWTLLQAVVLKVLLYL